MAPIVKLASSLDDVLAMILEEECPIQSEQVMAQYPYLFIH